MNQNDQDADKIVKNKSQFISLWSIDDDPFFHPLGLKNLGTEARTVVLTWNKHYILNFIIKNSLHTTIKKVRIRLPDADIVKDVLVLDLNTLLLMQSGRVYYFSSAKSVRNLPYLTGVRCISPTPPERFSVLRIVDINGCWQIVLEVYSDADLSVDKNQQCDSSSSTRLESFEIPNAELNFFGNAWQDEVFTHLSIIVTPDNIEFFQRLIGCNLHDLYTNQILHFFSISTYFYVFIANSQLENGFNIRLLNRYATNVIAIKLFPKTQLCCILLECGNIHVWYFPKGSCVLRQFIHSFETEFTFYDFAASQTEPILYYSTRDCVMELKFVYNSILDTINVAEQKLTMPGILACTWVPSMQELVGLSCNNIFYQLRFGQATTVKTEPLKERFKKINLNEIQQQLHFEREILQTLDAEHLKRKLLAAVNNCKNKKYFELSVEICKPFINMERIFTPSELKLRHDQKYILIKFQPSYEWNHLICTYACWYFQLTISNISYILNTNLFCNNDSQLNGFLTSWPANNKLMECELITNCSFRLINFISDGAIFISLELPLQLNLLKINENTLPKNFDETIPKILQLHSTAQNLTNVNDIDKAVIVHDFKFVHEIVVNNDAFQHLLTLFKLNPVVSENNDLSYALSQDTNLQYKSAINKLIVTSCHAEHIYNIKMQIIACTVLTNVISNTKQQLQQVQKCQSKLEWETSVYRKRDKENSISSLEPLHLTMLCNIYKQLRTSLQIICIHKNT